jgi:hypothetical protein
LGTAGAASGSGVKDAGGQIHGPEHQQGGVRVDAFGGENAVDLGLVPGKVARGLGDAETEDEGAATGAGHVVEARLSVEVMATAGAAADSRLLAAASVGEDVAAGSNDEAGIHKALRGSIVQGRTGGEGTREKSEGRWNESNQIPEMGKQ